MDMRARREQIAAKYVGDTAPEGAAGGSEGEADASTGVETENGFKLEMVDEGTIRVTHPDGRTMEVTPESHPDVFPQMAEMCSQQPSSAPPAK